MHDHFVKFALCECLSVSIENKFLVLSLVTPTLQLAAFRVNFMHFPVDYFGRILFCQCMVCFWCSMTTSRCQLSVIGFLFRGITKHLVPLFLSQEASSRQASHWTLLPPVNWGLRKRVMQQWLLCLLSELPPPGQQCSGRQGPGALQGQRQAVRPPPLQEGHQLCIPGEQLHQQGWPPQLGLWQPQDEPLSSGGFQRWGQQKQKSL